MSDSHASRIETFFLSCWSQAVFYFGLFFFLWFLDAALTQLLLRASARVVIRRLSLAKLHCVSHYVSVKNYDSLQTLSNIANKWTVEFILGKDDSFDKQMDECVAGVLQSHFQGTSIRTLDAAFLHINPNGRKN